MDACESSNSITNISTTLNFIGNSDELPITASVGDVIIKDETCYLWNGKWDVINTIDTIDYSEPNKELIERKCKCCGAPLKILSKYNAICEYCDSVYEFR